MLNFGFWFQVYLKRVRRSINDEGLLFQSVKYTVCMGASECIYAHQDKNSAQMWFVYTEGNSSIRRDIQSQLDTGE